MSFQIEALVNANDDASTYPDCPAGEGADVLSLDWRVPLDVARRTLGPDIAVQGNLDPAALLTTPDRVRKAVAGVLAEAGGRPGHIFNLGHGINRHSHVENVAAMVDTVRNGMAQ